MPAPTPIQIRYGPAGLLAQAASLTGQGEAWQNQHAQDMQFINSRLQNADRLQQQVVAGQQQDANRLQNAYAQTQPQQVQTPALDNDTLLKQTYLQSAASDIPDAEKASLQALAGSRMVKPDQFRLAVADAAKRGAQTTNDAAEEASKADYANQVAGNLPPEAKAGFLALAKDKKITAAQLRTAGDSILQRTAVATRVQKTQQIQGIDNQARTIKAQMDALVRAAAKEGVDLNTATPASANPTYRNPSQGVGSGDATSGFFNRVADKLLPGAGGTLVTPGNPTAHAAMVTYARMKNDLQTLKAKRDAIAGGETLDVQDNSAIAGSPADPTSVHLENGGQIVPVSSPDEAANLPTGTAFVTPDGQHWVKH